MSVTDEFVERVDHLARVPDDRRTAYYHTQKVEVTEYTTTHERHTKRQDHTESKPDGEDNLDVYYFKNLVSTRILLSTLRYAS